MDGGDYWITQTVDTDRNGMPNEPGEVNGGIYKRPVPQATPVNYVNVESVDEYLAKAKSLGATEIVGKMPIPHMGYFAQILDPQGNSLGLFQSDASAQ